MKDCLNCKKEFKGRKSQSYCSIICGAAKRKTGSDLICLECYGNFWEPGSRIKNGKGKYCSWNCYSNAQKNLIGESGRNWKGEDVGYSGLHQWIRKYYGYPKVCEICGIEGSKGRSGWSIQWAKLRDFEYERKRENFWGLCIECHNEYDLTPEKIERAKKALKDYNSNHSAWNKGKSRWWSSPTEFKKGSVPWNKGFTGYKLIRKIA